MKQEVVNGKPDLTAILKYIDAFIDDFCDGSEDKACNKVNFLLTYLSDKIPKLDPAKDHDYIVMLYSVYKNLCARFGRVMNQSGFRLFTGINKSRIDSLVKRQTYESIPRINEILEFWADTLRNQSADALLDDMSQAHKGGVTQMFIAKAVYGYNDNLAQEPAYIANEGISVDQLPDLSGQDLPKLGGRD